MVKSSIFDGLCIPTSFKSILNARSPLPHSSPIFPLKKLSSFVVYFQKEKFKKSIRRLKCLPQFQPLEITFLEERFRQVTSPLAVIQYLQVTTPAHHADNLRHLLKLTQLVL